MIRCACESSHTLACRPDGSRRAGAAFSALGLARLQRAHALGGLDGLAGAFGNVFPGIALIVSCGCAGAGRTGASSAIVVAHEHNAEAFVHGRLPYTGDLPMTAVPRQIQPV
jgi:hypothetical protein